MGQGALQAAPSNRPALSDKEAGARDAPPAAGGPVLRAEAQPFAPWAADGEGSLPWTPTDEDAAPSQPPVQEQVVEHEGPVEDAAPPPAPAGTQV